MSSKRPNRPVVAKSSVSNPLILPDTSLGHSPPNDVSGARSFVTQTWNIPDRPKPGRKPKQKPTHPESKQPPQRSEQTFVVDSGINSSVKNRPRSVIEIEVEPTTETKDLQTSISPEALQQTYINSLEAKIESLQTQQSEQTKYYKSLASQSTSKLNTIQSENDVLQSQVKVLRGEVLRLRKRISQLVKKSANDNASSMSIVIEDEPNSKESKVRKQGSHSEVTNSSSLVAQSSGNCTKKPRHLLDPNERIETNSNVSLEPKTQNSPKALSDIYLVEDSRTSALEPNSSSAKRIPDFTSSDIYCGLCTSELDCVCRQVGLKPPLGTIDPPTSDGTNNLLAVPIRRRLQPSTTNIWRLVTEDDSGSPIEATPETEPDVTRECNGNPKDCPACRDDPFGQAFCTALNQANVAHKSNTLDKLTTAGPSSITTQQLPQSDPVVDTYMSIPCCGDPELCGSQNCFQSSSSQSGAKISCSEAWRQLKVHPNIGLANLQLLADVVARKSTPYPPSSTPVDSNPTLLKHTQGPTYGYHSSSQSIQENEDPSFSPHVTLSTVFENVHADLDDDHPLESLSFQSNYPTKDPLNDHFNDTSNPCNYPQQKDLLNSTFPRRQVKFVEKESLDQALRMLDGASHRT